MSYNPDDDVLHHCCRIVGPVAIQEWTGTAWQVVDTSLSQGLKCRPLDPAKRPGRYVGEQVRTPCD